MSLNERTRFCARLPHIFPGGARPPTKAIISFINDYKADYGVGSICKELPIAPSTFYEQQAREANPDLLPPRLKRDLKLSDDMDRVWKENYGVYGARKVWRQMNREGIRFARCTVERLMRRLGIKGVVRGRRCRTTISDAAAACPLTL